MKSLEEIQSANFPSQSPKRVSFRRLQENYANLTVAQNLGARGIPTFRHYLPFTNMGCSTVAQDLNFESMQDSNLSIFSAKELQSGPQRKTLEFINYKSDIQLGICAFFPLRAKYHRLPHRFFSIRHDVPKKSKKMVFLFLIKRCLDLYVQLWGLYPIYGRR